VRVLHGCCLMSMLVASLFLLNTYKGVCPPKLRIVTMCVVSIAPLTLQG